jgi:single-strand DNA-binding protein
MNDLNSILIEGNATRDPELKYTPSGTAVCTFAIAVNRSFKKGETWEKEVSFFDIEAWGKLAEAISKNMHKGRGCRVVGTLKQERWEKDNTTHSKVKIIAGSCEFKFVEKKPEGQSNSSASQQNNSAPPDDCIPPDFPDSIPF